MDRRSDVERSSGSERLPPVQYVRAEHVIDAMATFGQDRLERLGLPRAFVLAAVAGGFITLGGLLSILLSAGIAGAGLARLVEGVAFSAGFFFVVLSEAVLFTEANVVLPATLLESHRPVRKVAAFWATAWIGNLIGAIATGELVMWAQSYPNASIDTLRHLADLKLQYWREGSIQAWLQVVGSGVLANWLVGMAAFFGMMGRTIFGKFIPISLAVTLFVAANFQHSPANMGYFALLHAHGEGPGWPIALGWNIVPAGIGNIIGAAVLVAIPFWFVFRPAGRG